jgi:hypothetical protein
VLIGIATSGVAELKIEKGAQAILAQEVRSPFAGKFTLKVQICGQSNDREWFEGVFLKQFACKVVLFQYTDPSKKASARQEHVYDLRSHGLKPPRRSGRWLKSPRSSSIRIPARIFPSAAAWASPSSWKK